MKKDVLFLIETSQSELSAEVISFHVLCLVFVVEQIIKKKYTLNCPTLPTLP